MVIDAGDRHSSVHLQTSRAQIGKVAPSSLLEQGYRLRMGGHRRLGSGKSRGVNFYLLGLVQYNYAVLMAKKNGAASGMETTPCTQKIGRTPGNLVCIKLFVPNFFCVQ